MPNSNDLYIAACDQASAYLKARLHVAMHFIFAPRHDGTAVKEVEAIYAAALAALLPACGPFFEMSMVPEVRLALEKSVGQWVHVAEPWNEGREQYVFVLTKTLEGLAKEHALAAQFYEKQAKTTSPGSFVTTVERAMRAADMVYVGDDQLLGVRNIAAANQVAASFRGASEEMIFRGSDSITISEDGYGVLVTADGVTRVNARFVLDANTDEERPLHPANIRD